MKFASQATADWRVLACAALVGSGVGMSLGAAYMAGGMAQVAAAHSRAGQMAQAAYGGTLINVDQQVAALQGAPADDRDQQAAFAAAGLDSAPDVQPKAARDLDCLTQAVYFEARGETARGQAAVAQVVMNRVKNPNFPKTVCGVVFQGAAHHGCQFSFACDGSMRQAREDGAWDRARRIAARTLSGVVLADIGSATHFHTTAVSPDWGPQMLRVAQVGLHVFYRFNPHAAAGRPAMADHAVFASLPTAPSEIRLASAVIPVAAGDGKSSAMPASAAATPAVAVVTGGPAEPHTAQALPTAPPAGLSKAADIGAPAAPKPAASAS